MDQGVPCPGDHLQQGTRGEPDGGAEERFIPISDRARARIEHLFDPDTFVEADATVRSADPLTFVDSQAYPDRIKKYEKDSGLPEAVVCGTGKIHGIAVSVAVMDFRFCGGCDGLRPRAKDHRGPSRRALEAQGAVAFIFSASGGARMQEGIFSLMQMAKTSAALGRLAEARLPYISVLTHPTMGASPPASRSWAMSIWPSPAPDRFRRGARDQGDDQADAAGGFPELGVFAQTRIDRSDREPSGDA